MDNVSEQRLSKIYPGLAAKLRKMDEILSAEGIVLRIVQGLRTYDEQAALYAQGRTTPGQRVTNASAGSSYHNYGLAVDVVPGMRGTQTWQPNWNPDHPDFKRMIEVGKSLGLVSGADFHHLPDYDHFQLTGVLPIGAPTAEAKQALISKGMEAVWVLAGLTETSNG
jgi:peptidoglycan L-alanyl-D-glutamate endopeptidase CwlK